MDVLYGLTKDFVFKEAVAFLKGKRTLTSEEYKMLSDESRAKAFTVSGYTSLEVLQEFLDCLTKAAEEGTTKEQFLKDMNRFLEEHGYEGINPWKCDNIFRTNMQTALNAGHYKSMTDETTMKLRPYWRYRTAGDGHVRESHAVMEGRVYRADDPIYVLEEGETILSLNKYGDLWEAETIAIPWIHHSQEVEVQHSKYSGIVTVEKTIVRSDDTGAVHMYIYFAGGEKDV